MGLPFSAFNKFGLPGLSSVTTGQVYDRHFKDRGTGNFADFHIAYVDFCQYFNTVMPGQDFDTPGLEDIKKFYENTWEQLKDEVEKKKKFIEFMEANIHEASVDDSLFIMAGLAAPAAAIIAKRSSESIPQVKKFKLQYIPNVVFVPLCTLIAIMGATAVQMNKKSKKPTS
uniref:Uncharacterized protein n=1 Tax=Avena sativa TaxID=4498 RepID=A0ACD5VAG3_AVESA